MATENVQHDNVKSRITLRSFARWPVFVITKGPKQNLSRVERENFHQPALNYIIINLSLRVPFVSFAMPLVNTEMKESVILMIIEMEILLQIISFLLLLLLLSLLLL